MSPGKEMDRTGILPGGSILCEYGIENCQSASSAAPGSGIDGTAGAGHRLVAFKHTTVNGPFDRTAAADTDRAAAMRTAHKVIRKCTIFHQHGTGFKKNGTAACIADGCLALLCNTVAFKNGIPDHSISVKVDRTAAGIYTCGVAAEQRTGHQKIKVSFFVVEINRAAGHPCLIGFENAVRHIQIISCVNRTAAGIGNVADEVGIGNIQNISCVNRSTAGGVLRALRAVLDEGTVCHLRFCGVAVNRSAIGIAGGIVRKKRICEGGRGGRGIHINRTPRIVKEFTVGDSDISLGDKRTRLMGIVGIALEHGVADDHLTATLTAVKY